MKSLPQSSIVRVSADTAEGFYQAAQQLNEYANKDYYDPDIQLTVLEHIRQQCNDEFEALQQQIKASLAQPPYSVVVKGLKFDLHYRVLVALNRALGLMVARPFDPKTPRAQLIHHVEQQTDINNHRQEANPFKKLSEKLHIDAADRPLPVRYVSMQCVRDDPAGGGRSILMDSHGFRDMLADHPEMIKLLEQTPMPWKMVDYMGGGVSWRSVLSGDCVYWRHYSIDRALAEPQVSLPPSIRQVVEQVDELVSNADEQLYDFALEPGDFLIVDNHRCLHARSPIENPATKRLMLRSWVE